MLCRCYVVFFMAYAAHRVLHVRTHACPTRRASDLRGAPQALSAVDSRPAGMSYWRTDSATAADCARATGATVAYSAVPSATHKVLATMPPFRLHAVFMISPRSQWRVATPDQPTRGCTTERGATVPRLERHAWGKPRRPRQQPCLLPPHHTPGTERWGVK